MANILIVDDLPEIRKNICRILKNIGHKIQEASNGVEALKLVHASDVDLIILDIMMPGKGGIETLVELADNKKVKKILITGFNVPQSEAFDKLIDHFGAECLLQKPFKKAELIAAVNCALQGK
jgi:CheY-like chemotaxis protein